MTIEQYRALQKGHKIFIRTFEENSLPSATDPTQAMPCSKLYEYLVEGKSIPVNERKAVFNGLSTPAQLTSIEKKSHDKFDVYAEQKKIAKKFSKAASLKVQPEKD